MQESFCFSYFFHFSKLSYLSLLVAFPLVFFPLSQWRVIQWLGWHMPSSQGQSPTAALTSACPFPLRVSQLQAMSENAGRWDNFTQTKPIFYDNFDIFPLQNLYFKSFADIHAYLPTFVIERLFRRSATNLFDNKEGRRIS